MAQIQNSDVLFRILKSTIDVISRRTSDSYANIVIGNVIEELKSDYELYEYVTIKKNTYSEEIIEAIELDEDVNNIKTSILGEGINQFIKQIIETLGKEAGYFFIKEIKEDIPYDLEQVVKDIGIDLDFLQLQFLADIKQKNKSEYENKMIFSYVLTLLYEILEKNKGRRFSYNSMDEIIKRISIENEILKYIKLNDPSLNQNLELIQIENDVNRYEPRYTGAAIQKIIQEICNYLEEREVYDFIEKLKRSVASAEYSSKLGNIGVNLDIIKLNQELMVKHVLKSLVDVLSDSSTINYAIFLVNDVLRKTEKRFVFFKDIKIDSMKIDEGEESVLISSDINSIRPSELGRGIQRIIENISVSLGDDAGKYFISKLKNRIGKAYILRIEEIGVNLHMIELKRNLMF